ncbi:MULTISPECIES: potassium channel family protein [unclassified Methanosarcina]|uniref:potassium channel family protein n=1 Tax=unclassified Methanosarcina TaxID=2644672 RepID=UPI000615C972|nr:MULTISPECIES: potassium channel family protein [unclassified Methanosarcina]AKB18308.1 Potassium channel protein [Methanosarcina sp. WWM596]AKB22124.1 Potassium channel protein [Methanosarcina sp. WH1]
MIQFLLPIIVIVRALRTLLKDPKFRSLLVLVIITLTMGTFFYHSVEGWSWLDSLYFSVITLTTVGYGDFTPQTDSGKIFTMIYIFLGLGILFGFITPIGEFLIDRRIERVEKRTQIKEKFENELDYSGVIGKLKRKR